MTKQDIIREGIAKEVVKYMMRKGYMIEAPFDLADNIMKREDSQGVVKQWNDLVSCPDCGKVFNIGDAVEPLIEEKHSPGDTSY